MSGPVSDQDVTGSGRAEQPAELGVEVVLSRETQVGGFPVRRALPRRVRRTVGAWCFVDHMGPADVSPEHAMDVAPHPHMGLQTVTWLLAGELVHCDSLGSEVVIRPGQLNLMTAGRGVSHSEEHTAPYRGELHGVQLWVAQPDSTRSGRPAFEHHTELPGVDLDGAVATVMVGQLGAAVSPARRDTDLVGADLELTGSTASIPLQRSWEYALVVLAGAVEVEGRTVAPGALAYLGQGRDEIRLARTEPGRCLLLGGVPFPEPVLMWWNFVARTREEIATAQRDWTQAAPRFGRVASSLPRIEVDPPPWA